MNNEKKWGMCSLLVLVWFVAMIIAYNVWPKLTTGENWFVDIAFFAIGAFLTILSVYYAIISGKEVVTND